MNASIINPERICGLNHYRTRDPSRFDLVHEIEFVSAPMPNAGRAELPDVAPKPQPVEPAGHTRRLFFRCFRLLITGAAAAGAMVYARHSINSATSEVAYINAEMTVMRAPIEGELRVMRDRVGEEIPRGATIFTVHNTRLGNQEVVAQWNWLRELTERLQAEADQAAVALKQEDEIYRVHEKLYEAKLISRLAFLEEQTKRALAESTLASKQSQARQAAARIQETERQLDLRKEAVVEMPFDGVAWSVAGKSGAPIATFEPVAQVIDRERIWVEAYFHEKYAPRLHNGAMVIIRSLDGSAQWKGQVESVRGGVGRIAFGNAVAVPPGTFTPRRIAVRVTMDGNNPYDASEFYGVGRSVVVSLDAHE